MSTDLNIALRVKERRHESSECLSVVFEKPRGLTFEAGDWLDIRFPVPEFPVGRTYSFKGEQTVIVCDVAIGQVRERLAAAFGEAIQYTTVDGKGTLIQAPSTTDSARFQAVTREAIAASQEASSEMESNEMRRCRGGIFARDFLKK